MRKFILLKQYTMNHQAFKYLLYILLAIGIAGCNNNKIPCPPTYGGSFPERKKKVKPGAQKPVVEKIRRSSSGVMPSDGRGSRTKVPK